MEHIFSKDSEERQMFADLYTLSQKFWIAENTDKYWDELFDEAEKFNDKYNNLQIAQSWIASFVQEKGREAERIGKKK